MCILFKDFVYAYNVVALFKDKPLLNFDIFCSLLSSQEYCESDINIKDNKIVSISPSLSHKLLNEQEKRYQC